MRSSRLVTVCVLTIVLVLVVVRRVLSALVLVVVWLVLIAIVALLHLVIVGRVCNRTVTWSCPACSHEGLAAGLSSSTGGKATVSC